MPMVAMLFSVRTHSCVLAYLRSGGVLDIARGLPCNTRGQGSSNVEVPVRSAEAALVEIDFIEAEVVPQFVEIGGADFLLERGDVRIRVVPKAFEEEDDLGRQRGEGGAGLRQFFAHEKAERVRRDAVVLPFGADLRFVGDGQGLSASAQRFGKATHGFPDLGFGQLQESGPMVRHESRCRQVRLRARN
jgi:hypothetical protein